MTAEQRFVWSEYVALHTSLRMDETNVLYDQMPAGDIDMDVMVQHINNYHAAGKNVFEIGFWNHVLKTVMSCRPTIHVRKRW